MSLDDAIRSLAPPEPGELWVVVGATATGKSELALALCRRFDGEVIGADSVQVYRHFDLGSGKPSQAERDELPHHLIDCVDPLATMDAARFVTLADDAIASVTSRGRRPIVCGGTFLWIKALLFGLADAGPKDDLVRTRHQQLVAERGRAALHEALARVDPEAAARLSPNDVLRVSRALEVFEVSGRPQTEVFREHAFRTPRFRARLLGVARERPDVDARIEARARAWLEAGWVAEVERLFADGYGEARAMGSVGFREVAAHLRGELPREQLLPTIVRSTRVFARRQRTWLRDQPVLWL